MTRSICVWGVVAATGIALVTHTAHGELTPVYQFSGKGNWSIDAVGSNNTPVGTVQALIPVGSTVERAFLYSSTNGPSSGPPNTATVNFDGTTYTPANFTYLGSTNGGSAGIIQAYRVDVTSQVIAKVGGGAGTFDFVVQSETDTQRVDGEVLAVVYSNPNEVVRTIGILDGVSVTNGDSFTFQAESPLPDPTTPGFEALLSLGIGFSAPFAGPQTSLVDINGRRLTSSAGGFDDGAGFDGALITAGGLGNSATNPSDPNTVSTDSNFDDELYNLALGNGANPAPFITAGDTSINVATLNPSNDDNIFFAAFNITAVGQVPEPACLSLLIAAAAIARGRQRRP